MPSGIKRVTKGFLRRIGSRESIESVPASGRARVSMRPPEPRPQWNALCVDAEPRTLIDVGAASNTPQFREAFPTARLFLIDPVREYEPQMKDAVEKRGGAYVIAAVGATRGEIEINVNVDNFEKSSVFERTALAAKPGRVERRNCEMMPLDDLVTRQRVEPPFGLKIDTEGYELEVIQGANETLKQSLFVIMEVSVQERFVGSYRFETIIAAMQQAGFQVGNILSAKPDGRGLVRFLDILFVPRN
jgi:FkbM family methyltransferase